MTNTNGDNKKMQKNFSQTIQHIKGQQNFRYHIPISFRHQAREPEPKDYDMHKEPKGA